MVFPIAAGVGYALVAGQPPSTAAFVGLALAATSIGITSRVLTELGVLDRPLQPDHHRGRASSTTSSPSS